jgi:hypothetical protein
MHGKSVRRALWLAVPAAAATGIMMLAPAAANAATAHPAHAQAARSTSAACDFAPSRGPGARVRGPGARVRGPGARGPGARILPSG